DNLPLHELTVSELDAIKQAALTRAVALEVGTRGLEVEHLAQYIAITERLGARALRTVLSGNMCGAEELTRAEDSIRQVLRELQQRNVVLALENNEAFSAAEFAGLMRRISNPRVGICLDTANSLGRPEPLQTVLRHLAPHAVMLHAKDYDINRIPTRMG